MYRSLLWETTASSVSLKLLANSTNHEKSSLNVTSIEVYEGCHTPDKQTFLIVDVEDQH